MYDQESPFKEKYNLQFNQLRCATCVGTRRCPPGFSIVVSRGVFASLLQHLEIEQRGTYRFCMDTCVCEMSTVYLHRICKIYENGYIYIYKLQYIGIQYIGGAFRARGGFSQPATAAESASQPDSDCGGISQPATVLRRNQPASQDAAAESASQPLRQNQPATAAESASQPPRRNQPASHRGGISQPATASQPDSDCGGISQPASVLRRNQSASLRGGIGQPATAAESASQPLRQNQPATAAESASQPATAAEFASQPLRRNQPASQRPRRNQPVSHHAAAATNTS